MSKGLQIAGGATLIALLLGWYAASNLEAGSSFAYFKTLAEFESAKSQLRGHHARVHGYVALGSIERDVAGKQVRFHVQGEPPHAEGARAPHAGGAPGEPLAVVFGSLETPDLFKDGAEVVVEGRLSETGEIFHADKVMAKCPSKFEGAPGRPAAI